MDIKSILNDAISELRESELPVGGNLGQTDYDSSLTSFLNQQRQENDRAVAAAQAAAARDAYDSSLTSFLNQQRQENDRDVAAAARDAEDSKRTAFLNRERQESDKAVAAALAAADATDSEREKNLAARLTPMQKLAAYKDMAIQYGKNALETEKGQKLVQTYNDVKKTIEDHPFLTAAIPGSFLAGAGAVSLRRRQMAAKGK